MMKFFCSFLSILHFTFYILHFFFKLQFGHLNKLMRKYALLI